VVTGYGIITEDRSLGGRCALATGGNACSWLGLAKLFGLLGEAFQHPLHCTPHEQGSFTRSIVYGYFFRSYRPGRSYSLTTLMT
jgi:hypothetical protein